MKKLLGGAVGLSLLFLPTPAVTQDPPLLGLLPIGIVRAAAPDDAMASAVAQIVREKLAAEGMEVVDLGDATLAVFTQYLEVAQSARLEVRLVRRPDRAVVARRVNSGSQAPSAEALAEMIVAEIRLALSEREGAAAEEWTHGTAPPDQELLLSAYEREGGSPTLAGG